MAVSDSCEYNFLVDVKHRGKRIRCPSCASPVLVGGAADVQQTRSTRKSSLKRRAVSHQTKKNSGLMIGAGIGAALLVASVIGAITMSLSQPAPKMAGDPDVVADVPSDNSNGIPLEIEITSSGTLESADRDTTKQPERGVLPRGKRSVLPSRGIKHAAEDDGSSVSNDQDVENPADDFVFSTWENFNEEIQPSVVRIDVQSMGSTSQGSGFVVDAEGIVATNYHVVGGTERITVTFRNGEDYIVSGFVYLDSNKDIALLKIDPASGNQQLKALPLLQDPPQTGSEVAAFGIPHGYDFTFTPGNVSAYRTSYEMQKSDSTVREGNWVQHTAAISKGSSGGPLVNRAGRVIAMNTLYVSEAQNLNFGISSIDLQLALNRRTSLLKVSAESAPDLNPNPSAR